MAREYCCLLLDIRECRRLLRYELCEDQAQNHSVTTLLHDQLRKELSKILLIGDVCEVYQSRSNCSADFWSFALTATILLLCVASVSYGLIKYSRLKQMTNQATIGNQQSG